MIRCPVCWSGPRRRPGDFHTFRCGCGRLSVVLRFGSGAARWVFYSGVGAERLDVRDGAASAWRRDGTRIPVHGADLGPEVARTVASALVVAVMSS